MKRFDRTPPWVSYEVLLRSEGGKLTADGKRPFSEALHAGGDQFLTALGLVWKAQYLGWPKAKTLLTDDKGNRRIVLSDEVDGKKIWILKAKPHCWRFYFYVYEEKKIFYYLYAVCKKKDKQEESDSRKARKLLDGVATGASGAIEIDFPDSESP